MQAYITFMSRIINDMILCLLLHCCFQCFAEYFGCVLLDPCFFLLNCYPLSTIFVAENARNSIIWSAIPYTPCLELNVLALVVSLSTRLNLFTPSIVYSDVLLSSCALDLQCTSDSVVKISVLNYILEAWLFSMTSSCRTSTACNFTWNCHNREISLLPFLVCAGALTFHI